MGSQKTSFDAAESTWALCTGPTMRPCGGRERVMAQIGLNLSLGRQEADATDTLTSWPSDDLACRSELT